MLAQPRDRRRFQLSEQLTRLRESVDELRVVLDGCRRPSCADRATWLWASVAVNQLALRVEAVEENFRLRRAIRLQLGRVLRSIELLPSSLQLMHERSECQVDFLNHRTLKDLSIQLELGARLVDALEIFGRFDPEAQLLYGEAQTGRDRLEQVDQTGTRMTARIRNVNYYPFQLSLVADIAWRLLVQDLCGHGTGHELFGEFAVNLAHSFERLEARSVCGLRRVFTSDGGVLFVVATRSVPSGSKDSNVLAGLQVYETSCWRLWRTNSMRTRVCSVVVTEIEVEALNRSSSFQLERLQQFCARVEKDLKSSGGQRLENVLLEESARRSRSYVR